MRQATTRSTVNRVALRAGAVLVLLAGQAAFGAVPHIGRDYFGTYAYDGSMSSDSFNLEVGAQTGKHLEHVSVFAMNLSELQGSGDLKKKNTVFKASTKASGKHAPKMKLVATVGPNGDTLEGTFELKRYQQAPMTGTFSVAR